MTTKSHGVYAPDGSLYITLTDGGGNLVSLTSLGIETATSLALGGATIGTNALAVTGTALIGTINGPSNIVDIQGVSRSIINVGFLLGGLPLIFNDVIGNSGDLFLSRAGAATLQLGNINAASAVAQTLRVQSVVAGTAAANGANWTFIGSLPTGTGTSGDIIFQTGVKTGSGTTQGTPTTALTIKGETQVANFTASVTANAFLAANSLYVGSGYPFRISGQADGIGTLYNNGATDFSRLQFGGTTSSFPSWKRSSAVLQARLADDSADADVGLRAGIHYGVAVGSLPTPVTGMVASVTDALTPIAGATVSAGGSAKALVWYNGTNWIVVAA